MESLLYQTEIYYGAAECPGVKVAVKAEAARQGSTAWGRRAAASCDSKEAPMLGRCFRVILHAFSLARLLKNSCQHSPLAGALGCLLSPHYCAIRRNPTHLNPTHRNPTQPNAPQYQDILTTSYSHMMHLSFHSPPGPPGPAAGFYLETMAKVDLSPPCTWQNLAPNSV